MALVTSPTSAELSSGKYTGDGTPSRFISGLGFQPVVVIVKGDLAESGVIRPGLYTPGLSKQLCSPAQQITDGILDLNTDGFEIGDGSSVNSSGIEYHWIAFSADPGELKLGGFIGDGDPDRWINGVGFFPEVLLIIPQADEPCQFRTIDMPTNYSTSFEGTGVYPNHIELFVYDAFQVGSDAAVNGSGAQYVYLAFNASDAKVAHGFYTGDGQEDRDIGPLDFGPKYVIVKSGEPQPAVHRTNSLQNPWSSYLWNDGYLNDGIVDLGDHHFTVGSSDPVNEPDRTFYYVAFKGHSLSADLEVSLAVDDSAPDVGQELTFDITLFNNNGPDDATMVTLDLDLPTGLTYTGDTPSVGTYDSDTGVWTVGDLNKDQTETLRVTATVDTGTDGQTLATTAWISGMVESDPDGTDNSATIDVTINVGTDADLAVAILVDDPTPDEGQQVVYIFYLANLGPADATGVAATVTLPTGLTYISDSPGAGSFDSDTGVWTVGPIDSAGTAQLRITASVDPGTSGSTLTTTVAVSASDQNDPDDTNDTASVGVDVRRVANLGLTAAFDNIHPRPGDLTVLSVILTNAGPDTASVIQIDLHLPPELSLGPVNLSTGVWNGIDSTWTLALLPPAVSDTLQMDLTVGDVAGGTELAATAVISALTEMDPDPLDDTATAMLAVDDPGEIILEVEPFDVSDRFLLPGEAPENVLLLNLINDSDSNEILTEITITNPITGAPDQATQDAAWDRLLLWRRVEEVQIQVGRTGEVLEDGRITFEGLNLRVLAGGFIRLAVRGAASLIASDGLELRPEIEAATDIIFSRDVTLQGTWPTAAPGTLTVDGMTAAQITLQPVDAEIFQIGSVRNLALEMILPPNGTIPDQLNRFPRASPGSLPLQLHTKLT